MKIRKRGSEGSGKSCTSTTAADAGADALRVRRDLCTAAIEGLTHAPWNPRSAEDLAPKNPEMQKLVASVKACGVIEPVVVWGKGGPDGFLVIAGNRRFAAAKIAGLKEIPAVWYTGLTEAEAREITRIENEVRLGVSPLKDAELIRDMIEKYGYSQTEVAAHFGVSEATVCRRMKLCSLAPEIVEVAEKRGNISTDALERIALYPTGTQKECAKWVGKCAEESDPGETVKWRTVSGKFKRTQRDLKSAPFDTSACFQCLKRTGAAADLWGDVEDGALGCCLDADCYEQAMHSADEKRAIEKAVEISGKNHVDMVDVDKSFPDDRWRIFGSNTRGMFANKPDAKHRVAWWKVESWGDREINIVWGPTAADYKKWVEDNEAAQAAAAEQREAEDKARREHSAKQAKLGGAVSAAFEDVCDVLQGFVNEEGAAKRIAAVLKACGLKDDGLAAWSGILVDGLTSMLDLYDPADQSRAYRRLDALPALTEEIGISSDAMEALGEAVAALEAFDAENGADAAKQ